MRKATRHTMTRKRSTQQIYPLRAPPQFPIFVLYFFCCLAFLLLQSANILWVLPQNIHLRALVKWSRLDWPSKDVSPWVHSSVVRAADRRSAGPWFKFGCALASFACAKHNRYSEIEIRLFVWLGSLFALVLVRKCTSQHDKRDLVLQCDLERAKNHTKQQKQFTQPVFSVLECAL